MSLLLLTIELTGLILGGSYLFFKHRQRVCSWVPQDDPRKWTGHGIEVAELKPQVEQVRRDYLAARQTARGVWFHRSLLGLARCAVMQLGFFRHRDTGENARDYGP